MLLVLIALEALSDNWRSINTYSGINVGDEQEEVARELLGLGVKLISVRRRDEIFVRNAGDLGKLESSKKIVATNDWDISAFLEFENDVVARSVVSVAVPKNIARRFQPGCNRDEVFKGLLALLKTTDDLVVFDVDPLRDSSYIDISKHDFPDSGLSNYEIWNFNVYDDPDDPHRVEFEFSAKNGVLTSIKIKRIPGP